MWDNAKRQRYNLLRRCEWEDGRTTKEQTELAAMIQEISNLEATYLQPATERRQQETAQLRVRLEQTIERKRQLDGLIRRKEALMARVNAFVTKAEGQSHGWLRQTLDGSRP